ncbi:Tetraacyldisaccharide 4'-kinase [Nocardioides sp. AX2bis]|nr:Tetraacyldisaccharide 4'-kinase [Nocardioides sp. AX2bis]
MTRPRGEERGDARRREVLPRLSRGRAHLRRGRPVARRRLLPRRGHRRRHQVRRRGRFRPRRRHARR